MKIKIILFLVAATGASCIAMNRNTSELKTPIKKQNSEKVCPGAPRKQRPINFQLQDNYLGNTRRVLAKEFI